MNINFYVTKNFFLCNSRIIITPKTDKIKSFFSFTQQKLRKRKIEIYEEIRGRQTRGKLSPSDRFIICG